MIVRDREIEAARPILQSGEPVYLEARLRWERDRDAPEEDDTPPEPKLTLQQIKPLAQALRERTKAVRVKVCVSGLICWRVSFGSGGVSSSSGASRSRSQRRRASR